jgi:hypothetical protein
MNTLDIDDVIRGTFDLEYEDQPDNISDYEGYIKFMFLRCAARNQDSKMRERIEEIVSASEEPEQQIDFIFLPGKHDTRDILDYALKFYDSNFLPNRSSLLEKFYKDMK